MVTGKEELIENICALNLDFDTLLKNEKLQTRNRDFINLNINHDLARLLRKSINRLKLEENDGRVEKATAKSYTDSSDIACLLEDTRETILKLEAESKMYASLLKRNSDVQSEKARKDEYVDWFVEEQREVFAKELDEIRQKDSFKGTKDDLNTIMEVLKLGADICYDNSDIGISNKIWDWPENQ